MHWWGNSNVCSLSYLESSLRGLDYTQSFTHKFVSGIYDISKTEWSKITNDITIVLLCVSVYFLFKSDAFGKALKCFQEKQIEYREHSFRTRMAEYIKCFEPLFMVC
ncbi:hypothetical protein EB077_01815 [bacterium]|nr:hypothetical protein [bacterium]